MIQHFHNICDYNIIIYDTYLRILSDNTDNTVSLLSSLILGRNNPCLLNERAAERTDGMKPRAFGNLLDAGKRLGIHQALALFHPELIHIIRKRHSQLLIE